MARRAARVRTRARRRARANPRIYRRRGRGQAVIPGEWGTAIAGGAVALLGGLTLSRFFTGLPRWLSPSGVALWLWGWWRGIPLFRWAGLFLIALSVAEWLGISSGLAQGINNALSRMGMAAGAAGGGAGTPAPMGGPAPGVQPSSDIQQATADLTAALNLYTTAQAAFA